ncbi:hypothetical protein EYR36_003331 [Pleurotus pulmonarius]|nr:hypothetical protein EYR36_003331 [Pleurotus pulmonarius]
MEAGNYHRHISSDRLLLKLVAWVSFLGSLALTVAIFVDARYLWVISTVGPPQGLVTVSGDIANMLISLLGFLSQIFFAWRILELSRKWWTPVFISSLATMQLVVFVVVDVRSKATQGQGSTPTYDFINTPSPYSSWIRHPSTAIWMGAAIACNLAITVPMTIHLYPALKDAVSARKWSNVPRILRLLFEMGVVTTILTLVITGFLFSKAPSTQYLRYIFYYPSGVLYSSWLLASLSARASAAQKTSPVVSVMGTKFTTPGEIRFRANTTQGPRDELTLTILTTVKEDVDEEGSSVGSASEKPIPPPKDAPQISLA